jgi:glycosyltransferase involved in cell wall biosynthesis
MIELNITPTERQWPARGGVREHLRLLVKAAQAHPNVSIVNHANGVVHVESAYMPSVGRTDVYVCHGGFEPKPLRSVLNNLAIARIIISVSRWICDAYFPMYGHKTVVIHNGIDLSEWEADTPYAIEPGYILFAKEWAYNFVEFVRMVNAFPRERFVTTVWPAGISRPKNVLVTGLLPKHELTRLLQHASMLVLTGTEVCPTMLLEAWACAVPVLAWNDRVTGASELMKFGKRVYGGALYTRDTMAEQFKYVLSNAVDLGTEGYMELVSRLQWKDQFEKYVQVYERLEELREVKAT